MAESDSDRLDHGLKNLLDRAIELDQRGMKKHDLSMEDFDIVELNEAFAVQALGCIKELGMDLDKTNLNGSGISIGHPIGCTGARITYSLAMQMKKNNAHLGLATLCIGGGQGMSIVLERP